VKQLTIDWHALELAFDDRAHEFGAGCTCYLDMESGERSLSGCGASGSSRRIPKARPTIRLRCPVYGISCSLKSVGVDPQIVVERGDDVAVFAWTRTVRRWRDTWTGRERSGTEV
jgi:hypothetical protein